MAQIVAFGRPASRPMVKKLSASFWFARYEVLG